MTKHFLYLTIFIPFGHNSFAQNNSSNVTVKSKTLIRILDGFYNYIKSENIKGSNAVATVTLQDYKTNNNYVEIELYPIKAAYLRGDDSSFYGYIMKDSFYCFFVNKNKYLNRDSTVLNPDIIKQPESKFSKTNSKQKIPKPIYHPYKWEIVFRNDSLLQISPKSTIEKFIPPK